MLLAFTLLSVDGPLSVLADTEMRNAWISGDHSNPRSVEIERDVLGKLNAVDESQYSGVVGKLFVEYKTNSEQLIICNVLGRTLEPKNFLTCFLDAWTKIQGWEAKERVIQMLSKIDLSKYETNSDWPKFAFRIWVLGFKSEETTVWLAAGTHIRSHIKNKVIQNEVKKILTKRQSFGTEYQSMWISVKLYKHMVHANVSKIGEEYSSALVIRINESSELDNVQKGILVYELDRERSWPYFVRGLNSESRSVRYRANMWLSSELGDVVPFDLSMEKFERNQVVEKWEEVIRKRKLEMSSEKIGSSD